MKIFLDDLRDPKDHNRPDFHWAKTAEEAIALLQKKDVTFISFDHDLGTELDGNDVAKEIESLVHDQKIPMPQWFVHSANSVGEGEIIASMKSAERFSKANTEAALSLTGEEPLLFTPLELPQAFLGNNGELRKSGKKNQSYANEIFAPGTMILNREENHHALYSMEFQCDLLVTQSPNEKSRVVPPQEAKAFRTTSWEPFDKAHLTHYEFLAWLEASERSFSEILEYFINRADDYAIGSLNALDIVPISEGRFHYYPAQAALEALRAKEEAVPA